MDAAADDRPDNPVAVRAEPLRHARWIENPDTVVPRDDSHEHALEHELPDRTSLAVGIDAGARNLRASRYPNASWHV